VDELGTNATLVDVSDAEDYYLHQLVDGEAKPVMKMLTANVLGAGARSCICRISIWPHYQQVPRASQNNNVGCMGGCGGREFQINRFGATVRSLTVWTVSSSPDSHIRAIRVTLSDGYNTVVGSPGGAHGPWMFTFQPGETVVGDLRLSGVDRGGGRLAAIAFSTSGGRSFDVGTRRVERYLFPTGNAFMAGFMGRAGTDVDQLGVVFWKPIRSIVYESLTYPTLTSLTRITSPDQVASRTYCNNAPFPLPFFAEEISREVQIGSESCIETSATTQFGMSLSVSGGIPGIVEIGGGGEWQVSQSRQFTNCRTRRETRRQTFTSLPIELPGNSRIEFVFSQWTGRLNHLPFEATLRITLQDGATFTRRETGTYTGVWFTAVTQSWDNWQNGTTRC